MKIKNKRYKTKMKIKYKYDFDIYGEIVSISATSVDQAIRKIWDKYPHFTKRELNNRLISWREIKEENNEG